MRLPIPRGAVGDTTPLVLASIAVGASHSCGLTASGQAWCWGRNGDGQLGDGTFTNRLTPIRAGGSAGLTFVRLDAGYAHTCGLTSDGTLYCWGRNRSGQLGVGSFVTTAAPTAIPTLRFSSVSVGDVHTCAIGTLNAGLGTVYCWGDNTSGQLGDGTTTLSNVPKAITTTLAGARLVSAGGAHTCAFLGATAALATLQCWGSNDFFQIDETTTAFRMTPVATALSGASSIYSGSWHLCGLNGGGRARCRGYNASGQLGFASGAASGSGNAGGNRAYTALEAGDRTTCGRTSAGEVWCWGGNDLGQLGNGTTTGSVDPVRVSGPAMTAIGVGDGHACGLATSGETWCWGDNASGQVGDSTQQQRLAPSRVLQIAVGS